MMVKPWAHLPGDSKEYAIFTYECGDVNLVKTMGQTGGKPPTNLKANRIFFFARIFYAPFIETETIEFPRAGHFSSSFPRIKIIEPNVFWI